MSDLIILFQTLRECFFLGEGEGDAIYASDVKYILADDVVRLFDNDNCPHLRNKPKMFFFQFCRGGEYIGQMYG